MYAYRRNLVGEWELPNRELEFKVRHSPRVFRLSYAFCQRANYLSGKHQANVVLVGLHRGASDTTRIPSQKGAGRLDGNRRGVRTIDPLIEKHLISTHRTIASG